VSTSDSSDGPGEQELRQDGVGEPDALERLWTPHRMAYIRGQNKPGDAKAGNGCPFCRIPGLPDDEGLMVHRGDAAYVVLNLYPYSPGHLLVCPYRHVADYTELDAAETAEVADLTQTAMRVIRQVSGAHGFNVGMNQGSIAGAGIAAHLHQHVVPRWAGDQNFMPIIGRTKTLPQLMAETRSLLAAAWPTVA
jgi:ATP adenylyltransferase